LSNLIDLFNSMANASEMLPNAWSHSGIVSRGLQQSNPFRNRDIRRGAVDRGSEAYFGVPFSSVKYLLHTLIGSKMNGDVISRSGYGHPPTIGEPGLDNASQSHRLLVDFF